MKAEDDQEDVDAAEKAALRILSGAGQSAVGLTRRLRRRGFSDTAARAALERWCVRGYVDDRALAESMARRLQRSGHGRARVAAELRARGIEEESLSAALGAAESGDDARALEVGRRLLAREMRRPDSDGTRRRIASALQRRGFSGAT